MKPGSVMKQIKLQEQHASMKSSATGECRSVSLQLTDHDTRKNKNGPQTGTREFSKLPVHK